ncbi:Oidioi.mRNA.OKI2018_I69.chr1.g874.t1.cds [Oikopleura dioica]|uniref:Oidioi.mRNA.OKI2018_I69.chr1.g874.t1.cds n=1 Tax=Oikopleura dioica TaxID=34765 RepID=A0ABN7SL95_OIKDI|nr:Oidioi.mRNA.OKI2018_I69.chr1.g874.t1.cds [Oikopleura dioica]
MTDSEKKNELRHRNVGSESQSKNVGPPIMNIGPPAAGGFPELICGRNEQQRAHEDDVEQGQGHPSSRDEEPLLQGDDDTSNQETQQLQPQQPPQQNRQIQDWSWKDIVVGQLVQLTQAVVPLLDAKTKGEKIRNYLLLVLGVLNIVLVVLYIGFQLVRMIFYPEQTSAQIIDAFFTKISEKILFSGASPVAIDVHLEVPDLATEN